MIVAWSVDDSASWALAILPCVRNCIIRSAPNTRQTRVSESCAFRVLIAPHPVARSPDARPAHHHGAQAIAFSLVSKLAERTSWSGSAGGLRWGGLSRIRRRAGCLG